MYVWQIMFNFLLDHAFAKRAGDHLIIAKDHSLLGAANNKVTQKYNVYACARARVCVWACVHLYVCKCVCVCVRALVCAYVCVSVSACSCQSVCVHA